MPTKLENSPVAQGPEKVFCIPVLKKDNTK